MSVCECLRVARRANTEGKKQHYALPEVVAPLADAVRLVDHDARQAAGGGEAVERAHQGVAARDLFGRHEEQAHRGRAGRQPEVLGFFGQLCFFGRCLGV